MNYSEPLPQLIDEIRIWQEGGIGIEPPTAGMLGALALAYDSETQLSDETPKPITELLRDVANFQMVINKKLPSAALTFLRTVGVRYFVRSMQEAGGGDFTDADLTNTSAWVPNISRLAADLSSPTPSNAAQTLQEDVLFRGGVTPAWRRYASVNTILQLVSPERFPNDEFGQPTGRILDVGASTMFGAFTLAYDEFPASIEKVTHHNDDLTNRVHTLLARQAVTKTVIANDIERFYIQTQLDNGDVREGYDVAHAELALSALRPSERNDPAVKDLVLRMMGKKEPGSPNYDSEKRVMFEWGNLLDNTYYQEFTAKHPQKLHAAVMSFVSQEIPRELPEIHARIVSLLEDNGILIYLHHAHIRNGQPGDLAPITSVVPYKNYASKPNRTEMHIADLALDPEGNVQHAMTFLDNRCQVASLQSAKLATRGMALGLPEMIKLSTP